MNDGDAQLAGLAARIVAVEPDLAGARFALVTQGWDSLIVQADERLIFKFPRDPEAEQALRREARLLALVAEHVDVPVPRLRIIEADPIFSRHEMIVGSHLLAAHYAILPAEACSVLADSLALFLAQTHKIDIAAAREAGCGSVFQWLDGDALMSALQTRLDGALLSAAKDAIAAWTALPPDPYGETFGHFDLHG